jgi:hypothetical protein
MPPGVLGLERAGFNTLDGLDSKERPIADYEFAELVDITV